MSKAMLKDLERCLKAIDELNGFPSYRRLDFHYQRAEQKAVEFCMNFVIKHHKRISKLMEDKP